MLQISVRSLFIAFIFALLSGCKSDSAPANSRTASSQPPAIAEQRPAPALRVKSLNLTKPDIILSDFPGKFVLIDFWATWCAPCREEVPYLKKAYERFGNDPRFAMLSISLDRGPTAPREFIASHGMNWPQGFAGTASQSADLTTRWNVNAIPAVFLLNPEGKIIATGLRGKEIGRAIQRAMQSDMGINPKSESPKSESNPKPE